MGESQSRREQVLMQQAVLLGDDACKWKGKEGVALVTLRFPCLPSLLPGSCVPCLPSHSQAVGCLPGKGCAPVAPRMCCRGSRGGGGPLAVRCSWEERAGAGPEVRFALLWERVN